MLRKGSSVTNIIGIGSSSAGNTSSTSTTSSPYHQPHHHHHPLRSQQQQHYRSSSTSRESHSQQRYQNHHHQRITSSSTPPTSCTLEGTCTTSTSPKRGSHSQSTGDITVSGDSRSPVRHNQSHCCGCSCATNQSSSQNAIAVGTKASSSKSASESLLRHVVTSSGTSPRAGSPKQQQPLLCSTNHSVVSSNSNNRDCPADSHPRVTTKPNHNSGTINNKLWLFGSKEEDDDDEPCDEDDEGDGVSENERRGQRAPPVTRSRRHVYSASGGGGGVGVQVDSTPSHAYSPGQPNPSPVIVAATVPCQYQFHQNVVGGGNSSFYNNAAGTAPGAIFTSTPIGTNQTGLFKVQSPACSSSNISISPPTNQVVASELLLPMDFIQVLIHQHAKTIVALQDLQREVSTLKDFRTSLLHSLPATGAPPVPGPNGLSEAVWKTGGANGGGAVGGSPASTAHPTPTASTGAGGAAGTSGSSAAPKIPHPDSGFSTETKSTNQKSDAESDDELYSLLSLIQCKVQESIIRNDYLLSSHHTSRTGPVGAQGGGPASTSRSRRKSDNNTSGSKPKERLGKLDKVLGNCDKVEFRKDFISRDVIRGVLGAEKTELQRQLFFALVKIENLKSLSKEQKTIDSRVHALSQENEQLRYKLKEMEIELEGTKATLRILQKTSYSPSATLRISKSSSSSSTSVLPEAACHLANNPSPLTHSSHHNHYHNQSSNPNNSRLAVPVIPATPTWENDSLDENNTDFAIPGATTTSVVSSSQAAVGASASAHSSSSSASTATRQRLIQKLSDIESSSSSVVSSPSNNNSTIRLSSNSSTNNNNYTNYGSSSKKSPAPKPPVIIEHTTSTTTSPPTSNNNNNNNNTVKQQKSASPVGNKSMSSIKSNNSSIPIAVSRLKAGKASGTPSSNSSSSNTSVANNASGGKALSGKMKTGSSNNSPNTGIGGSGGTGGGSSENGGNGTFWANWFRS